MNSKSIHIDQNIHSNFDAAALQSASIIRKIYKGLSGLLFRSELEKAQARYQAKQQRQGPQHDILKDFSTEDKLFHCMYRWMD
jgi:hypothetical protein